MAAVGAVDAATREGGRQVTRWAPLRDGEEVAAARSRGRRSAGAVRVWAAGLPFLFSFFLLIILSVDRWLDGCGMERWRVGRMDGRHVIDPCDN